MSEAVRFPRTRLVVAISVLALLACAAWVALGSHKRLADPFTFLLIGTAALASLTLYDLDEALFMGGSLIANVCAIGVLGPAPAASVALAGEIAVLAVDRYRLSAFPMNLLGGVLPNMAGASLFQSVVPAGIGISYYLALFGVAWVAVLINGGLVTFLVALERGEPAVARLRPLRQLVAPVALNVLVAIGAVAVYRSEGLDGAVFVFGALLVFAYSAKQLTTQQRQLTRISKLADSRGRLVAQTLEAEDRERRVMADALHDHVIQPLLVLRQDLAGADLSRLEELLKAVDATIAQLRTGIRATHPSVLERIGLGPALEAVADYHAARAGIRATIDVELGVPTRYDRLLFSTARELLINVVRHADARHVRIEVSKHEGNIRLSVEDDGVGWDLQDLAVLVRGGHFGLPSIVDRVDAVGGTVSVRRRSGTPGTLAVAILPLDVAVVRTTASAPADSNRLSVG